MLFRIVAQLSVIAILQVEASLKEFVLWKQVEYENLPSNVEFIRYNNVPQGFAPYITTNSSRLFIAVPRRSSGVPSTLNYVELNDGQDFYLNPKLLSYPNYEMNEATDQPNADRIVSVYRPRIDECDRLWFVDIGVTNTSGISRTVQPPSIWVIDLKTDNVVSRHEIPPSVTRSGLGLANIAVDVIDCAGNTFAYVPNLETSQVVVYNLNENRSYSFSHNFFHMHPLQGDYDVDGLRFSWDDGIFSIALSERDKDSYRMAYFHAMSSFSEFAVSTKVLRDESLAARSYHGDDFKLIGRRGKKSQSTMHAVHQKTGTMFFAEINKNAVSCWDMRRPLRPSNMGEVARDNVTLIYPTDLNVVGDDLWVLSNRMFRHIYSSLDVNDINFRIFRTPVKEAIKGTKCEVKSSRGGNVSIGN